MHVLRASGPCWKNRARSATPGAHECSIGRMPAPQPSTSTNVAMNIGKIAEEDRSNPGFALAHLKSERRRRLDGSWLDALLDRREHEGACDGALRLRRCKDKMRANVQGTTLLLQWRRQLVVKANMNDGYRPLAVQRPLFRLDDLPTAAIGPVSQFLWSPAGGCRRKRCPYPSAWSPTSSPPASARNYHRVAHSTCGGG